MQFIYTLWISFWTFIHFNAIRKEMSKQLEKSPRLYSCAGVSISRSPTHTLFVYRLSKRSTPSRELFPHWLNRTQNLFSKWVNVDCSITLWFVNVNSCCVFKKISYSIEWHWKIKVIIYLNCLIGSKTPCLHFGVCNL